MSQMPPPYHEPTNVNLYQEPERTSIMAVLSMVFGIGGCCLGVTSIPAILLGILGLMGISRSKGRVGGTGFGIAGIIVGLLTLAIWVGLLFGLGGAFKVSMNQFSTNMETILTDIQTDQFDAARAAMVPPAADVSDEQLVAFRQAYRASVGDYVSRPSGWGELWTGYMAILPQMQGFQGRPGFVPIPLRFDAGWVLVMYEMNPSSPGSNTPGVPAPQGLILIDAQGNEFHLPPAPAKPASATPKPNPDTAPQGTGDDRTPDDQTPGDQSTDDEDGQGP